MKLLSCFFYQVQITINLPTRQSNHLFLLLDAFKMVLEIGLLSLFLPSTGLYLLFVCISCLGGFQFNILLDCWMDHGNDTC